MKKILLILLMLLVVTSVYAQNNDIFIFGGMYDQGKFDEIGFSHHSYTYGDFFAAEDLGSLAAATDSGTGFGLIYTRMLNEKLGIEMGYETFTNDLEIISTYAGSFSTPEGITGAFSDMSTFNGEIKNAITQVNARYYFNPEANFRYYGLLGVGLNTIHLEADAIGWIPENDVLFGDQLYFPVRMKADDFNAFTFNMGVGGDYKVGERIAVTFDLRYFYALNNETVVWHVMPGSYTDTTGEAVLDLGCEEGTCDNYNLAGAWDSWFDYSINYKPSFYRAVVGIKFMF